MSRMYIVNHWNDAAAYSGEQIGDRLRDSSALHFNRDGSANTELYSEETALAKKKTSVPLIDRVLPQQRRVRVLTEQLYELEAERKAGLDLVTYSQLRDILIVKRDRAEVLLQKALSVRPMSSETDEDYAQVQAEYTLSSGFSPSPNDGHTSEGTAPVGVVFIDSLSETNSLKNILKKACVVCRTLVRWHNRTKAYVQTLKEV